MHKLCLVVTALDQTVGVTDFGPPVQQIGKVRPDLFHTGLPSSKYARSPSVNVSSRQLLTAPPGYAPDLLASKDALEHREQYASHTRVPRMGRGLLCV